MSENENEKQKRILSMEKFDIIEKSGKVSLVSVLVSESTNDMIAMNLPADA